MQGGYLDDTGTAARFNHPTGIAVDGSGNVYVADELNNTIRKVTSAGVVTTLVGNSTVDETILGALPASLDNPVSVGLEPATGNLLVVVPYCVLKVWL